MRLVRHYVAGRMLQQMEDDRRRMPSNPLRDGYVFMGWYCNPNGPAGRYGDNDGVRLLPSVFLEPGLAKVVYARWMPSFDLRLYSNNGSNMWDVRNVAINYSIGFNGMRDHGRWYSSPAQMLGHGMVHMNPQFHSLGWRFTPRTGFEPTNTNPGIYNFYQSPIPGSSIIMTDDFVFTPEFLEQYGTVGPNGRITVTAYMQWQSTVTFNANLYNVAAGAGTHIRTATIAEGHSVNSALSPTLHHTHQPNRSHVWGTITAQANPAFWFGTTGLVANSAGTRGGWPIYRSWDLPLRGGHWPALALSGPQYNLIGWSTDPTGQNPNAWV